MSLTAIMPIVEYLGGKDYLYLALNSYNAFSNADTTLKIHLDGANPIVEAFLYRQDVEYTKSKWKGLTNTLDKMIRKCSTEYVIPVHDDVVFSPEWDVNLLKNMKPDRIVSPHLISHGPPRPRGYKEVDTYFGLTAKTFDAFAFLEYVKNHKKDQLLPWKSGIQCMSVDLYRDIGGFDLQFTPFGFFDLDFHLRCIEHGATLLEAQDSMLYHFASKGKKAMQQVKWSDIEDEQTRLFTEKWNMSIEEANEHCLKKIKESLK